MEGESQKLTIKVLNVFADPDHAKNPLTKNAENPKEARETIERLQVNFREAIRKATDDEEATMETVWGPLMQEIGESEETPSRDELLRSVQGTRENIERKLKEIEETPAKAAKELTEALKAIIQQVPAAMEKLFEFDWDSRLTPKLIGRVVEETLNERRGKEAGEDFPLNLIIRIAAEIGKQRRRETYELSTSPLPYGSATKIINIFGALPRKKATILGLSVFKNLSVKIIARILKTDEGEVTQIIRDGEAKLETIFPPETRQQLDKQKTVDLLGQVRRKIGPTKKQDKKNGELLLLLFRNPERFEQANVDLDEFFGD
jgi:hypothetical protein